MRLTGLLGLALDCLICIDVKLLGLLMPKLAFPNYESELPESREEFYPGYSGYQPRPPMPIAGTNSKLSKLYLPKLKGDITKFIAFWDSFKSSVDDNRDISIVDKFSYLYSLLEGEALRAVQGLPLIAENCKIAVDTLHDRFKVNIS